MSAIDTLRFNRDAAPGLDKVPDCLRNGMKADVEKIIETAQMGWLSKYQVLYLLENWQDLGLKISPVTPQRPPSGTMFLFDRTVNRYFRKDGHEWRKKGDGCTVRETHEKIKIAEKGVLNCYYAHSEEAAGIMRRSYWLLDGSDNVVLVHYLEGMASRRMLTQADGTPSSRPPARKRRASQCDDRPAKRPEPSHSLTAQHMYGYEPDRMHRARLDAIGAIPQEMYDEQIANLSMMLGAHAAYHPAAAEGMNMAAAAAAAAAAFPPGAALAGHHPLHLDPALLHQHLAQHPHYLPGLALGPHDLQGNPMLMQHAQMAAMEHAQAEMSRQQQRGGGLDVGLHGGMHSVAELYSRAEKEHASSMANGRGSPVRSTGLAAPMSMASLQQHAAMMHPMHMAHLAHGHAPYMMSPMAMMPMQQSGSPTKHDRGE